jgi:hypothetical protein
MGGLSYFDNGGQAEPDQEVDTSSARLQVKPTAAKGKIQYPALSGTVPAGQSTLQAMEEMYQEMLARQTGLSGFLESAKDAQAWWTPGGANRAQALDTRSKAREQQTADMFNMRSQIAQYKAAMEDQAKFEKEKPQLLGQSSALSGIDLQPHEVDMLNRAPNRSEFNKLLEKFVLERTKGLSQPGAAENKYPVLMKDEEGNFTIVNEVPLADRNRLIRSGEGIMPGGQPPAARPGVATPRPTSAPAPIAAPPMTTAAVPPEGNLTAADMAIPPAPVAAPKVVPASVISPRVAAAPPVNYTADEITPAQMQVFKEKFKTDPRTKDLIHSPLDRPDFPELFNKLPLEKRQEIFSSLGTDESVQPTRVAAAPSATMTDVAAPGIGAVTRPTPVAQAAPKQTLTMPQIRAQEELRKQRASEQAKTEAESERTHNAAAETAIDRERTASEIIKVVTQNPEIAGVLQQPGIAAALGTLVQTGISAPGGHSIGIKEIDEVLFKGQKNLTRDQIVARDRLRSLLNKTSLNAASIMKGQGAVTEFERQLLQNMVGSLNNTPENLVKIQKVLMENAINRRKIDEMYKRSGMAWGDFVKTEKYINLQNTYNKRLEELESETITFGKGKSAAPAQPFSKEEEAAYQEWKKKQKERQKK